MTSIAPFLPDRFASAAPSYAEARPRYSRRLIERLGEETRLNQSARVLDLGCGPGILAIALARHAGTVIGMDPSADMLASAVVLAGRAGVAVDWRLGSSRNLEASLAPLDLVVMGRSFHWMDRAATLTDLARLVAPRGAVALLSTETLPGPASTWTTAYDAVLAAYGREDDFARFRKTPLWEPHHEVLLHSEFSVLERFGIIEEREATLDGLVARALSQSSTTTAALGDRHQEFVTALRDALLSAEPTGRFPEVIESVALLARRRI